MDKKIITSPEAPAAIGPYSHAVSANGFLFVSGQLPINPATGEVPADIQSQTRQVMDNLMAIVKSAGLGPDDIVRATIYLTDMNDFATVNEIYASYFNDTFPARATLGISALAKGAIVEVDAIAAIPQK